VESPLSFLLLKAFARFSLELVFTKVFLECFAKFYVTFANIVFGQNLKTNCPRELAFSLFGVVAQNLAVVFIKWRM
jgi:hypothetical protein